MTSFFDQVDRLVARSHAEVLETRDALKACGWILRPLSAGGMWRARRHTRGGTERIYGTTSGELIEKAVAELKARRARRVRPRDLAEVAP